jgi:hemoglobin-like flavoprotein
MLQQSLALDREDIAAIRESAAWALMDPLDWAARFYRRVFLLRPGLRVLFAADLEAQQHKLLLTLRALLDALDHVEDLEPRLEQLGAAHRVYGAKPAHYPIICQAFVDTLAETSRAGFTQAHRQAWMRLLAYVTSTMLRGALSGAGHVDL